VHNERTANLRVGILLGSSLYFEFICLVTFFEAPTALNHSQLRIDRALVVDLVFSAVLLNEIDLVIVQLSLEIKFANLINT